MEKHDKLVRDGIPDVIRKNGERPVTHVAIEEEYPGRLDKKLQEEVEEYLTRGDAAELVDILEVIYAIADAKGVSKDELEKARHEKLRKRGGFGNRIVLDRVE